jgi:hypothetical protein
MIKRTLVRSIYSKTLVTCYESDGKLYVANQHGDFDVFQGEYTQDNRTGTLKTDSAEIKAILSEYRKQGGR